MQVPQAFDVINLVNQGLGFFRNKALPDGQGFQHTLLHSLLNSLLYPFLYFLMKPISRSHSLMRSANMRFTS